MDTNMARSINTKTAHQAAVSERGYSKVEQCHSTEYDSGEDGINIDVTGTQREAAEEAENVQLNLTQKEEMASWDRQNKDDVLSVVIQKLTELVKSSEGSYPSANNSSKSGGSSGANTPPIAAPEGKKKTRGKRQNKTQLYKCPSCPCLFAIRKRDLKKGRKILCACCEKLKQATADVGEPTHKTPPQIVPLESWKVVCDVCSHWVSDYSSLLYHLAGHSGVQIFKCKLCDFVTTKQDRIENHQATHRPKEIQNKFICSICSNFATIDLAKMEEHLKAHDQKKLLVLKCSVCGYTCRSEEVLRYHMVTHVLESTAAKESSKSGGTSRPGDEEDSTFKCSVCGYSCDKLSTLKSHSWRHAGDQSCSYPVEKCSDDEEITKNAELPDQNKEAVTSNSEIPHDVEDESHNLEDNNDLSRLAIGCCGPKGQSCCSKEASDKCHCESFNVPASQQPLLQDFFNKIVNKSTETVIVEESKKEMIVSDNAEQKVVTKTVNDTRLSFSPEQEIAPGKLYADEEPQGDEVKEVLEECSSLMNHFFHKAGQIATIQKENTPYSSSPSGDKRLVHAAISCTADVQLPSTSSVGGKQACALSSSSSEADVNQDTAMNAENDDGDLIVITEITNIDSLLANTGSIVEVTTSDEPHHQLGVQNPCSEKDQTKVALKRLLPPNLDEGPCAKRQQLKDSPGEEEATVGKSKFIDSDMDSYQHDQIGSNKLKCPFCNKCLFDFKNLKKHLLDHCREQVLLKCQKCPSKFSTEVLLAEHQQEHEDTQSRNTGNVLHVGNINTQLRDSIVADPCTAGGRSSNKKCSLCDRKFRTKASLYLHEQECTAEKKEFTCIECDFLGITKDQINKHISENHKKPFKCALCEYISATPSGIKNHMKFHAVDKRYKCHWCDFSGSYPQSLKAHLKTHASCTEDAKLPCEQYKCKLCGYLSCHLPSMKSHMWRHAQDPGFDYNARLDEIIRNAKPVVPHNDKAVEQRGLIYITPLQNTTQGRITGQTVQPQPNKVTRENQSVVPAAAVPLLIFKCTQCGFQSNTRSSLIDHLRGHLAGDGRGVKLG